MYVRVFAREAGNRGRTKDCPLFSFVSWPNLTVMAAAPQNLLSTSPATRSTRVRPFAPYICASPVCKPRAAPLVLSYPPNASALKAHTICPFIGARLIQHFPSPMASPSEPLGGGAGAAALTGATGVGTAPPSPRPCFLAARPQAVTGGSLCLQTSPDSSPVCISVYVVPNLLVFTTPSDP